MHNKINSILNISEITNENSDTLHDRTAVNGYGYTSQTAGCSYINQINVPQTLSDAIAVGGRMIEAFI